MKSEILESERVRGVWSECIYQWAANGLQRSILNGSPFWSFILTTPSTYTKSSQRETDDIHIPRSVTNNHTSSPPPPQTRNVDRERDGRQTYSGYMSLVRQPLDQWVFGQGIKPQPLNLNTVGLMSVGLLSPHTTHPNLYQPTIAIKIYHQIQANVNPMEHARNYRSFTLHHDSTCY